MNNVANAACCKLMLNRLSECVETSPFA